MSKFLQSKIFVIRFRYLTMIRSFIRQLYFSMLGMKVGNGTKLPSLQITWPHQVQIGNNCSLEHNVSFKYDGIWQDGPSIIIGNDVFIGTGCEFNIVKRIEVGNDCLIASGSRFIDHNHGTLKHTLMKNQETPSSEIILGNDVWIGFNCVILKGVTIGTGAVVAAGSIVTKSIPPYEVWAGIPAKKISERK